MKHWRSSLSRAVGRRTPTTISGLAMPNDSVQTNPTRTQTPAMDERRARAIRGRRSAAYRSREIVHMCMMDEVQQVTSAICQTAHRARPNGQWPAIAHRVSPNYRQSTPRATAPTRHLCGRWNFAIAGTIASSEPHVRNPNVIGDVFRRLLKTFLFTRHGTSTLSALEGTCAIQIYIDIDIDILLHLDQFPLLANGRFLLLFHVSGTAWHEMSL